MKTPLKWLKEYVDIKGLSPQEISDGLRFSGTENVLEEGSTLSEKIVVGEIKEIAKHPNADKLQIATVSVTSHLSPDTSNLTIVCGAPNIKAGQKVPVALVGTKFEEFEIKKAKIRDIESSGMLCSEKELGLGEDHSGIMILGPEAKVGQPLSEYLGLGEAVIDAELTPNRGDCLSMVGMAREVAATFNRKFKMPTVKKPEINSKKKIGVEVIDKDLCPRYIAKVIEGIKIGPSPKWMQERLIAAGVRPISNIVDVTNYVMLELGQPLHAFDYEKLSGGREQKSGESKKIIVRKAKRGEKIVTLDSVSRSLTADDLLICDAEKPIALAGVMGGLNSEVDEQTTAIVLEAAVFDSTAVRKTAQRLSLRSEASNRFEKGLSLRLPEVAIERAAELILAIMNQHPKSKPMVGKNTDVLSSWIWTQRAGLRLSRIKGLLGVEIPEVEVLDILKSLGFEAEKFDFKAEARKHVGKPYIFGASYKTHGDMAFDCSYLTDYIYSKIGKFIGYTSLAQHELGQPIAADDLQPGDVLFVRGHIDKSVTDYYFIPDNKGGYQKVLLEKPKEVGHNALYIGNGRVVHARHFEFDTKNNKWKKLPTGKVVEEDVEVFTKNPEYLGARRFVDNPDEHIAITVPWWRLDVKIEEDILEELGRIYGYGRIPATLPSGPLPVHAQDKRVKMENRLKHKLVDQGLTEVITYSFVSAKLAKISGLEMTTLPKINNPLSIDQEYMRGALWPSLLEVAAKNQDYSNNLKFFEIANVFKPQKLGGEGQELHFGAVAKMSNGKASFYELKGIVWSLFREFNLSQLELKSATVTFSNDGQGARIFIGKKSIGEIGVVSSKIREEFGQKTDLAIVEINIAALIPDFGREIIYQPLSKFPRSRRDINLVFDQTVMVADIMKTIAMAKAENLLNYQVTDIYEGSGRDRGGDLSSGKKSVTISLEIGSVERTLNDQEIESSVKMVVKALEGIGGTLRQ